VIYMGLKNLASIVSSLLDAGLPPDTPACVIENGTLKNQRQIISSVKQLPAAAAKLASPAIVVIGEVVRYARVAGALPMKRAAA
jgi:uroporphyrin-III C-methyltransferase